MKDRSRLIMRILFGLVMFLLGVTIALLADSITSPIGALGKSLGLALIITGTITVFQETVTSPLKKDEVKANIDRISDENKECFDRVFGLLRGPGIYMLAPERRGHPHYHKWLLEKLPQELFFAGHSVLHRVGADFKSLGLLPVHEALKQKVSEGSKIRILFLDPTWNLIEKIAEDEGQELVSLLTDLATTLGICRTLWDHIENEKLAGDIDIRTCMDLKQYAFHHVRCSDRNEDEVLVGFYFARRLGTKSPLFVIENEQVKEFFIEHFNTIFEGSKRLLSFSRDGVRTFDQIYYRSCQDLFAQHIDYKLLSQLCP